MDQAALLKNLNDLASLDGYASYCCKPAMQKAAEDAINKLGEDDPTNQTCAVSRPARIAEKTKVEFVRFTH